MEPDLISNPSMKPAPICGHPILAKHKGYRGNCYKCYQVYASLVHRNKITWQQLEIENKVYPHARGRVCKVYTPGQATLTDIEDLKETFDKIRVFFIESERTGKVIDKEYNSCLLVKSNDATQVVFCFFDGKYVGTLGYVE